MENVNRHGLLAALFKYLKYLLIIGIVLSLFATNFSTPIQRGIAHIHQVFVIEEEDPIAQEKLQYLSKTHLNMSKLLGKPLRFSRPFLTTSLIHPHKPSGENISHKAISDSIHDNYLVPSAVHFVLPFHKPTLEFHQLVCFLSAFWIIRPKRLLIWYNELPTGEYWDYFTKNVTNYNDRIILVYRSKPMEVYGIPINTKEHAADIVRMEALLLYGGVYLDIDVISLRSLDSLRGFPFTIGRENENGLCNSAMLSEPSSLFMLVWSITYQTLDDLQWGYHSVILPNTMQKYWSHLTHIEHESMDRPNWTSSEIDMIYGNKRVWDWKAKNYVMHLWYRFHNQQYNFETIKHVDSMLGDMFRYVLYGSEKMW